MESVSLINYYWDNVRKEVLNELNDHIGKNMEGRNLNEREGLYYHMIRIRIQESPYRLS